jgi:hypothetical protein
VSQIKSNFVSVLGTVLASAVADDGTFTVSYPSGYTQDSFNAGHAGSGHYAVLNNNDKWSAADPGIAVSFGASNITITNQSGYSWPAGTKVDLYFDLVKGKARIPLVIPLPPLAGITAADIITDMRPGIEGDIEYAEFVTTVAVTTAAKAATLNFEIGTTDVTGLTLALTSATVTPKGKVLPFGLPTANKRLTRESKLSLEASAVTAFAEGEGYINLYIRPLENDVY